MIHLSTFKSWGFNMFGVKTKKMVKTNMFIKSANKDKTYRHQEVKGATKTAAERFINGTNFVTKHSVS